MGEPVKYDRPVWQLMYDCAAAMPDPFRYEDVHRWFARTYPEIGQATIRAHLVGLCEGGRPKQAQFASRAPIFRRVSRGMYEVIPEGERKIDPDLPADGDPTSVSPSSSDDTSSGTDGPVRDPFVDPFVDSAFDDATVVRAPRPGSDAEPAVDRDAEPVARAVGSTFEDLIERSGLAGELQVVPDPTAESADVLLVASDGERVLVPAPSREIFRSDDFQSARLRAQARGARWYVLSAEHGLLDPSEWVSPDSRALGDLSPHFRQVWAEWVLVRLESLEGAVAGRRVHVIAPHAYVGPLAAVLQDAGAEVTVGGPERPDDLSAVRDRPRPPLVVQPRPSPQRGLGGSDAVRVPSTQDEPVRAEPVPVVSSAVVAGQDDPLLDDDEVSLVVRHLGDAGGAVVPDRLDAIQEVPGLFAWHVDADGARMLNRSLMLPVGAGVLHVGHAGALGRWPDAVHSLRHLVQDVQLEGRSRSSMFRAALAVVLSEPLAMRSLDDPALTDWMRRHLRVVTWPTAERDSIHALAHRVVAALEPPLNVDHLRAGEMRRRLAELRRLHG